MRRQINVIILTFLAAVALVCAGCTKMSESISDETAGMNGSFEIVKSGLPVNWLVYTPNTIPRGDYELIVDTTEHKDGKQSLLFLVRECSSTGGWYSPGFCNEFDAAPGEKYKVSFWVRNHNSTFFARVGGVSAFKGQYETVVSSSESIDTWRMFEHTYTIPEGMDKIRFEMNVLSPGSFWIDDLKITRLTTVDE